MVAWTNRIPHVVVTNRAISVVGNNSDFPRLADLLCPLSVSQFALRAAPEAAMSAEFNTNISVTNMTPICGAGQ